MMKLQINPRKKRTHNLLLMMIRRKRATRRMMIPLLVMIRRKRNLLRKKITAQVRRNQLPTVHQLLREQNLSPGKPRSSRRLTFLKRAKS